MKTGITGGLLVLVMLAACSSAATGAPRTRVHVTASAARAGCQQATMVAAAVSASLEKNPPATAAALSQIKSLDSSLPLATLKLDVDKAVLDLALFRQYAQMGGPVAKAAGTFAADLRKIQADCAA